MCGIAGFSLNPKDFNINARALAQELLLGIEERGQDATGAAWRNRNGDIVTHKRDWAAKAFVPTLSLDKRARLAILHTRMWTQGSPKNPLNNHPIQSGHIIGVHNGTVSNDDELFREVPNYKRQGEVDSEAIFAHISQVTGSYPLLKALEAPEARMALAWLDMEDMHDNVLHLARGDGSPLVVAQTKNGSLVFASTRKAVLNAGKSVGLDFPFLEDVKEGTYYKVRDGVIVEAAQFEPNTPWGYYSRSTYTSTSVTNGKSYTVRRSSNTIAKDHAHTYLDLSLLDPGKKVEEMSTQTFQASHKKRVDNITEWMDEHSWFDDKTGELLSSEAVFKEAAEMGAFLRPGMEVSTWACGEWCKAQVYRLPETFPGGTYILRVEMPMYDAHYKVVGYEPMFLARSIEDMDSPNMVWEPEKKELPALTS